MTDIQEEEEKMDSRRYETASHDTDDLDVQKAVPWSIV